MNRTTMLSEISSFIAEILETDFVLLDENCVLIDDVGLDSMGFLELAIQIQRRYNVLIPNEEWKDIVTIGDLVNKLDSKMKENETN